MEMEVGEGVPAGMTHAGAACKRSLSLSFPVGLMGEVLKCTGLMQMLVLKPFTGEHIVDSRACLQAKVVAQCCDFSCI